MKMIVKNAIALAVLALSVGSAFAGPTLDRIKETSTFTVGHRENAMPYGMLDNRGFAMGYSVDIAKEIKKDVEKAVGVSLAIKWTPVTAQNRIALVQNGGIDAEFGATTNTEERRKQVNFYNIASDTVAVVTVATNKGLKSLEESKGKTIGVVTGTTGEKLWRKMDSEKSLGLRIVPVKDNAQLLLLLEQGRVDFVSTDKVMLAAEVAKQSNPNKYSLRPWSVNEPDLIGAMVSKDDAEFNALIERSMARIKKDGTLERIYAKWFTQPIPPNNINLNIPLTAESKKLIMESK